MDLLRQRSAAEIAAARRLLLADRGRPELNRVARLAARLLGSRSAQVSLLTEVQTVAGGAGLPAEVLGSETPLADSLCTVTASCGEPLVLPDARVDARVQDLPPVASGAVVSYLGVPLRTEEDQVVGALCVFGPAPHGWSPADVTLLEQLALSAAAELELAALTDDVESNRVRWELAIEAAGIGSFDWDLNTGVLEWDERLTAMFGYDADTFDRTIDAFLTRIHPDDRSRVDQALHHAIDGGGELEIEYRVVLPPGATRWVQARGRVLADDSGRPQYLVGAASDVTRQRESEAGARLSAQLGEQLTGSLDVDTAVAVLARGVVPQLADWSLVSVVGADGVLRDATGWHADPLSRPLLDRYLAARADVSDEAVLGQVARSPRPVLVATGATAHAVDALDSPAAAEAMARLAPESAVVLPLTARGHLVGVLRLYRGAGRPPMPDHEVQAATGIAERAGLALDNIRLYAEQRSTAEQLRAANQRLEAVAAHERTVARALQDAMLTRLPEPADLHLVARYRTATGTDRVGGDWYDAVVLPSGATTAVIGDVAGHDIAAAAVMGQLRNLLRAFVWDRPDDLPSASVARLDRAMRELGVGCLATLTIVRIEQEAGDGASAPRLLRWTNAGHPPPVLVRPDGSAVVLTGSHDLLLGVDAGMARHDHTHPFPPGSTLILHTDGLIETRTADVDAGQRRLLDALRRHHTLPPGRLLDAVLADMVGPQPDDDVAVLAVRFSPAATD